jgi:parvulin-like peptidyl-prolyl isomerase
VRPVHFDLAAIRLPLPGDDLQESFRQAERLVYQLDSGELRFDEAARRFSRHPSAADGGRLGWVSRQMLPHIYGLKALRAIHSMQVGEMSGLVQDDDEWWIFRLVAKEEERPMTWDEARQEAEDRLGTERAREVEAQLRQELVQRLRLEVVSPELVPVQQ